MDDRKQKAASTAINRVNVADSFAKTLMVRYLGRREADLGTLRSALAADDFESIRIKGHNLYGSGSAYGLDRISELGGEIEAAALGQNRTEITRLIGSLESFIRNLSVV